MKINYLAPASLQAAIQSLVNSCYPKSQLSPFVSIQEYQQQNYDLWLVDSQHLQSIVVPNIRFIYTKVLVVGHYTDQATQQAFCLDHRFTYIAYSQIESQLPDYLSHLSA